MLINLHVKNLALIEEADINFSKGLNIITGETGAGKSILIGSINAALGNKVPADFVRSGAEYGLVELTFKVDNPNIISRLKELEVSDADDGEILITRKIMSGRSTLKVNGETKVVSEVRRITPLLIDIHGQHEHQSLMNRANYIPIIDKYARNELSDIMDELKSSYDGYKKLKKEYSGYNLDAESLKREMAFMEFEINEIDEAELKEGEDEELEHRFRLYNNSRKIMDGINAAMSLLSLDNVNAADNISHALKEVNHVLDYDSEGLSGIVSQLADIEDILNGLNSDLNDYAGKMDFDESEFRYVDERLSMINSLKLKYGNSIDEILEYRNVRSEKLSQYKSYEENKEAVFEKLEKSEKEVRKICRKVTEIRRTAAGKLDKDIKNALLELNFPDVQFETRIDETEGFNENGNNEAEFLISANPGESMRPLSKVASGGELSRIMLAIKTVLSDKDEIETLIFDEIDTGISGRTAQMVAVKLNENSRCHQVLCITHLPQIASMADTHFLIEKKVVENKTVTTINRLDDKSSVLELARLLGGSAITENVINNAREMKELAFKSKIC